MRKKRTRQTPALSIEGAAVFICTATLLLILYIISGGSKYGMLLTFAAPSTHENIRQEAEHTILVKLTPKEISNSEEVLSSTASGINLSATQSDKPTILIYHTHTLEAYTPTEKYPYTEHGGKWRTDDNTRNIVTVGEQLANHLRSYGLNVIHDTTDHEPPKLSTAYERSLQTMLSYKKKYPSLVMYIDLHRDACDDDVVNDYCVIDGEKTAKVMFVVGTGKGATGTGFSEMPDFDSNKAYAQAIMDSLKKIDKNLVREMRIKPGRYNQHVSSCCLLIEIGHNMNTLEEALSATKHVAHGIMEAISG